MLTKSLFTSAIAALFLLFAIWTFHDHHTDAPTAIAPADRNCD